MREAPSHEKQTISTMGIVLLVITVPTLRLEFTLLNPQGVLQARCHQPPSRTAWTLAHHRTTHVLSTLRIAVLALSMLVLTVHSAARADSSRCYSRSSKSLSDAQRQALHPLLDVQIEGLTQNLDKMTRNHEGLESTVLYLTDRTDRLEEIVQRLTSLGDALEKGLVCINMSPSGATTRSLRSTGHSSRRITPRSFVRQRAIS